MIQIGRCDFHDAATGLRCESLGRELSLKTDLGHRCRRTLCREHSDWIEAREETNATT